FDSLRAVRFGGNRTSRRSGSDVIHKLRRGMTRRGRQLLRFRSLRVARFLPRTRHELKTFCRRLAEAVFHLRGEKTVRRNKLIGLSPDAVALELTPTTEGP